MSQDSINETDWSKMSCLDPELLSAFVAVIDSGGFTAAARQLHKTQSTISLRIHTLEERLGARVFVRTSRRLALSQEGERFLVYARRLLQLQFEAIRALSRGSSVGVIRFGLPEDYAGVWLPSLLTKFFELRPDVRPHIHCRMSLELLAQLEAGELDLALVVRHSARSGGKHLGNEELVWAAHDDFILDMNTPIPLALFPEGCTYRQRALEALALVERDWQLVFTSQSQTGIRVAVNHGSAATIIDKRTLPSNWRILGEQEGLPRLPAAELVLHRSACQRAPAVDDLADLIEKMINTRHPILSTPILRAVEPISHQPIREFR